MKNNSLLTVVFFVLCTSTSFAQLYEPIGPWGGRVNAFTKTTSGNIYVATIGAGFFKSTDNGNSWREVNSRGTVRTSFALTSIGDTIFGAPFGDGVYKTTDGGQSWIADTIGGLGARSIYALYADDSNNLYAGGLNTGIFYKASGSDSWENITNNLPLGNSPNPKTVRSIFKDSNGILYIGTEGGVAPNDAGIYSSSNNGITWIRQSTGLGTTSPSVRSFAEYNDTLIVGVFSGGAGVYRKALSGSTWTIDTLGLGARGINAIHADQAGNIYAGINPTNPGGVFRKLVGENNWSQVLLPGQSVWGFLSLEGETLIGSNLWAVSRTADFSSVSISNLGINALSVLSLKVSSNGNLYAGLNSNGGIYKSTNDGATWQIDTLGFGARTAWAIEELNGTLYAAGSSNGIFKNNGTQWVPANTGISTRLVEAIITFGDTLIIGTSTSGTNPVIYRSENGGNSWIGATFTGLPSFGSIRSLTKDNSGNLYAGMSSTTTVLRGLLKSTNGGRSWVQSNGIMNPLNEEFYALGFNEITNTLYAAPNVSGIYRSTNQGISWISDSIGVGNISVDDFLVPKTLPPTSGLDGSLLIACLGQNTEGGVFAKVVNESQWQRKGLDLFSVNDLEEKNGALYAATNHSGIYKVNYVTIGLPVELIEFAYQVAGNIVELSWRTVSEQNNAGFAIERQLKSGTDLSEWVTIGFVSGRGTTTEAQTYSFRDEAANGIAFYRLKQIDFDGKFQYSNILEVNMSQPLSFELSQNYPNPFNPTTIILYRLPVKSAVKLDLFDVLGRKVATLVNENQSPGLYRVVLSATNFQLSTGVYFYKLQSGNFTQTRKMLYLK